MRRGLLLLLLPLLVVSFHGTAQLWHGNTYVQKSPDATLLVNDSNRIVIRFDLNGFHTQTVSTPNGTQAIVSVPQMASMLEKGAPDLPQYPIPVIIGDRSEMRVSVIDGQYTDYPDIEIAPSKGIISRQVNPDDVPYTYESMYRENAFYPNTPAYLESPYILRDFRGQNIMVRPFAYNPVTKTLRVYQNLTIEMNATGHEGENPKTSRKRRTITIDAERSHAYSRLFINYSPKAPYTFIEDEGEMVVICPEAYLEAMRPFVDWKNLSGRPTTLVNLTEIGGNDEVLIKDFLKGIYDDPNRDLAFILLVGDYDDITPHAVPQGRSDAWFGQLEGYDNYIEAFVGRFSVESIADVETQVNKVLYYERDMPASTEWTNKGIGIADSQAGGHYGEADNVHIDFIRDTLLHYTYTAVSQQYDGTGPGTNSELISADLNAGASICNYCSHGSQTGWFVGNYNNSDIQALTNDYRWPCIISVACLNGQFNFASGPCFAETWMRAVNGNTGVPTGAIGGLFAWNSQAWQPPMYGQDEMNDILTEWSHSDRYHHTMGGALLNGNMKVLEMCPTDAGITHNNWILFGDPSLLLRTDIPTDMRVSTYPESLHIGITQLIVTSQSDNGLATLSLNGSTLASQRLVNGSATLSFPALDQTGAVQLVVTGFNKATHVQDLAIVPTEGAYLICDGFEIIDENGQADYGENIDLLLTIKNIGYDPANNINITLSGESESVNVLNGNTTLPSIAAQTSLALETPFRLAISKDIVDGEQAAFKVTCSDGSESWESHFVITLHAPVLELVSSYVTGDPLPGETGTLNIGIRNAGSGNAHNGRLELYCNSALIAIPNPVHLFGDIETGAIKEAHIAFSIDQGAGYGTAFSAMFIASADHFSLEGNTLIHAGNLIETFESSGNLSDTTFHWNGIGADWVIDNTCAHSGTNSARSGAIGSPGVTELRATVNVLSDGQVSFYQKTSSEAGHDFLKFYIDNTEMKTWSGVTDWRHETFQVNAGPHVFRWLYIKDSSGSYGDDCAWIDDVELPAVSTAISIDPVSNLQALVHGNQIDLGWTYPSGHTFIIRCNGNTVATTTEHVFSDTRGDGTYLYSVTAADNQGHYSAPRFVIVDLGVTSLPETSTAMSVFPNPTHGQLNIRFANPIDHVEYAISNILGQIVGTGQLYFVDNTAQCDLSHLRKGIYFLSLHNDYQMITYKIIKQ